MVQGVIDARDSGHFAQVLVFFFFFLAQWAVLEYGLLVMIVFRLVGIVLSLEYVIACNDMSRNGD